jgi:periplasmic mercuric ion binding protein
MRKVFLVIIALLVSVSGLKAAQKETPRKMCATIKTSAECEFCKRNIEESLGKVKGIRKVRVDFVKHEVYVTYNSKKISLEKIRTELNDMGYDADGQKANFDKYKVPDHDKK